MIEYTDEKLQEILDAPYEGFKDCDAWSIRSYLYLLLATLWEEGEGFSGKRPFGNSDWEYDLYKCLVSNGYIKGEIEDCGNGYCDLTSFDKLKANQLIRILILHCTGSQNQWSI